MRTMEEEREWRGRSRIQTLGRGAVVVGQVVHVRAAADSRAKG